jgi:hypothetical protein
MCASSAVQGGLKSKKIVYAYQARLNAVQHCRSIEDYVILQADATSVACKAIDFSSELYFESHCYMGDATHQEAIDLEKIHIGVCSSFAAGVMAVSEAMGDNGCLNVALFNPARTSAVCDLQIQSSGTSEYTYKLMMSELASVGCPSWEDRAREAYLHPSRFSLYAFGLDKGPDNSANAPRIAACLENVPNVAFAITWCFLHQLHLIYKVVYATMDTWVWDVSCVYGSSDHDPIKGCKYFSGIGTITNVWRSTGVGQAMQRAAIALWGEEVDCCRVRPGRPLKNRWGALAKIEKIIIDNLPYLPGIFWKLFGHKIDSATYDASPAVGPGADEAQQFSLQQKAYRRNATVLLGTAHFRALIVISSIGTRLLTEFLNWSQKKIAEFKKLADDALSNGVAYMGPTLLSIVVITKAADVMSEFSVMLGATAIDDPLRWGPIWDHVGSEPELRSQALLLIVTIILQQAVAWDFRYMARVGDFPLLFLFIVDKPNNVQDARRVTVVRKLLETPLCCLWRFDSDFAIKVKLFFAASLQSVIETDGLCPLDLYVCVLSFRASLPFDTQRVEGLASYLQELSRRMPSVSVAGASARLQAKHGQRVTVQDCLNLDEHARELMGTAIWQNRFAPMVARACDVPAPVPLRVCEHARPRNSVFGKAFALDAYRNFKKGCHRCYSFLGMYVLYPWSYYLTPFVFEVIRVQSDGDDFVMLRFPLASRQLSDCFGSLFAAREEVPTKLTRVPVRVLALTWESTCKAIVNGDEPLVDLKPRAPPQAAVPGDVLPLPLRDVDPAGGDGDGDGGDDEYHCPNY